MARILYGVQGEGRGHATRSLRVLQALIHEGHEVLVLTGGDALPVLAPALGNRVIEVPLLRYRYNTHGALSPLRTLVDNLGPLWRMAFRNPALEATVRRFRPAAVVSDFEPVSCRLARVFRLPLLAVDHQHFLTEATLPRVRGLRNRLMLLAYRLGTHVLSGWPRRVVVSSFHHFPRKRGSRATFVGPFLPEDVRRLANPAHAHHSHSDAHITVYLKRPHYLKSLAATFAAHPDRVFEIFSGWETEWSEPLPRNVQLRPVSREGFLKSLATSHALVTTAGNQVLGEAIWLGKPALALPEPGVLEQAFNARALEESGCGMACGLEDFSPAVLTWFEQKHARYVDGLRAFQGAHPSYDGLEATLRIIRRLVKSPANVPTGMPQKIPVANPLAAN